MIKSIRLLAVLFFVMISLQGCLPAAMVELEYPAPHSSFFPSPSAPKLSVVLFEDIRTDLNVGMKRDGTYYTATSSVAQWVSRALADELSIMGPQVSFAQNLSEAESANPDYIVTGKVTDVWVKETNLASYSASIKVSFELMQGYNVLYSETLTAMQETQTVPTSTTVQKLLSNTLSEITSVAASKISERTK